GVSDPPTAVKVVWGLLQSSIAAVLLFSGGLQGLQTASVVAAAPFAVIMCLMCYSLMIALGQEFETSAEGGTPSRPAKAADGDERSSGPGQDQAG
ncbi:MAG TPA: BCCT family transporter, partial [Sphingobacteriaceae bacterium]